VSLRNIGIGDALNTSVLLRSGDARFVVTDSVSSYGTIPAGSNGTGEPFTCAAGGSIPLETTIPLSVIATADSFCDTFNFEVIVGQMNQYDPVPDGPRQPAVYWAYDDVDALYQEHPEFSWYEINTRGQSLRLADDQTEMVTLPFSWTLYGWTENSMSICSNGWISPGYTAEASPNNTVLPGGPVPGMVCANWDDLDPELGGTIYLYHDALHHRYIVEWDGVPCAADTTIRDKFQILLYDGTVPTPNGDNLIVMQYLVADGFASSTVGIQDMSRGMGVTCLFDGTSHRASAPIAANRAIKFTSASPTAVVEPRQPGAVSAVSAIPNPFTASVRLSLPGTGTRTVRIFDNSGRHVRTLSGTDLVWDGRDEARVRVATGVYFASSQGSAVRTRLVLAR
jgi:hypothetical protein